MKNEIKFLIIGLIAGGLIVWTITKLVSSNPSESNMQVMNNAMQSGNIDAHFIEQMIPHHDEAIAMAKLAQTKAQRNEIKQMAGNIISSQSAENTQMREWYKNWFGREMPSGSEVMQHHAMGSSESNTNTLETASDFDRAFVEEMIPHHLSAVMMASMLKAGSNRPEMKKLADDIITVQTSEIDQMRKWLKEWE